MNAIADIQELSDMSTDMLVQKHRELLKREPRSRNRQYLIRRCAHALEVARCGGLSEVARQRLAELMAEIAMPTAAPQCTVAGSITKSPRATTAKPTSKPRALAVGTLLERDWRGTRIRVQVVAGGFEYDGAVYKSLSAVAHAVTGAHWNGPLFFGLTGRGRKS